MFGGDEEVFGEGAADAGGVEEVEEFYFVVEVGAGGVAEGVAAALEAAGEEVADVGAVVWRCRVPGGRVCATFRPGLRRFARRCRACRGIR